MENNELNLIPEAEIEKPKFHYEPMQTFTEEIPLYDENGNQTGTETRITGRILKKVWTDEEELKKQQDADNVRALKVELAKIKEDIEQEIFGLVRYDYEANKIRAAQIINELRALEGKQPREIKNSISTTSYVESYLNSIK